MPRQSLPKNPGSLRDARILRAFATESEYQSVSILLLKQADNPRLSLPARQTALGSGDLKFSRTPHITRGYLIVVMADDSLPVEG
ncbi:hypothetical protein [Nitrosospira multiformis]|uniref:Uncharacterized protein n=1 Tax=Nitrosospira multiformis (strain ATCC 25196 / NCIMB 11849 / C 71) TaxID=323848 RepID=Q2Y846_NITMU|nr:hypothetical protein [Nitrosospira multiformis]ABB75075.1 hypothetical protein Nmul_A1778 [Nitrosospira multiformis ATCC 25196]